jgi:hypothetical protein
MTHFIIELRKTRWGKKIDGADFKYFQRQHDEGICMTSIRGSKAWAVLFEDGVVVDGKGRVVGLCKLFSCGCGNVSDVVGIGDSKKED